MNRKMHSYLAFITRWPLLVLKTIALLALVQSAGAQTAGTGALTGAVVDAGGGTVAGAKVVVTSQATGEARTAITDDRGGFLISTLLPQLYSVEISKDGFKTLSIRRRGPGS
jgi:Carboxypeptidase regulatory-like domain